MRNCDYDFYTRVQKAENQRKTEEIKRNSPEAIRETIHDFFDGVYSYDAISASLLSYFEETEELRDFCDECNYLVKQNHPSYITPTSAAEAIDRICNADSFEQDCIVKLEDNINDLLSHIFSAT